MAKRKLDLDQIPIIQSKIIALIDREIDVLADKDSLTEEEGHLVLSYSNALVRLYQDYREEVLQIKKELKGMNKEDLQNMVRAEVK